MATPVLLGMSYVNRGRSVASAIAWKWVIKPSCGVGCSTGHSHDAMRAGCSRSFGARDGMRGVVRADTGHHPRAIADGLDDCGHQVAILWSVLVADSPVVR